MKKLKTYIGVTHEPISINKCWQGKRFKTPEYKTWREFMQWKIKTPEQVKGYCEIEIVVNIKNYKMADVDNFCKPILDSLVDAGAIEDDRKVVSLKITKKQAKAESIHILITPIENITKKD